MYHNTRLYNNRLSALPLPSSLISTSKKKDVSSLEEIKKRDELFARCGKEASEKLCAVNNLYSDLENIKQELLDNFEQQFDDYKEIIGISYAEIITQHDGFLNQETQRILQKTLKEKEEYVALRKSLLHFEETCKNLNKDDKYDLFEIAQNPHCKDIANFEEEYHRQQRYAVLRDIFKKYKTCEENRFLEYKMEIVKQSRSFPEAHYSSIDHLKELHDPEIVIAFIDNLKRGLESHLNNEKELSFYVEKAGGDFINAQLMGKYVVQFLEQLKYFSPLGCGEPQPGTSKQELRKLPSLGYFRENCQEIFSDLPFFLYECFGLTVDAENESRPSSPPLIDDGMPDETKELILKLINQERF